MKDPIKIGDKIWHFDGSILREGIVTSDSNHVDCVGYVHSEGSTYGYRDWNEQRSSPTIFSNVYRRPSEYTELTERIQNHREHLRMISDRIVREHKHGTESESSFIDSLPVTDKIQPLVGCH